MPDYVQRFVRLRARSDGQWIAPPQLRSKLVEDAREQETNLSEVVFLALSKRYGVPFAPNGRSSTPNPDAEELNLRMPASLDAAVRLAAASSGRSVQREILSTLCDHYGLRMPPKPVHSRRRAPRAAAA